MAPDGFTCEDLKSDITQLGIILYPADRLNEKFLIKIRECMLKLPEDHPVKLWLKKAVRAVPMSAGDQKKATFMTEILTSKFNLITDLNVKNRIIEVLIDVPEKTFAEKIMKSYLYLMIGNVTRSDNILRAMMREPPVRSWEGFSTSPSFYHRIALENHASMISKMARHPSDRKTFELFSLYLSSFMNDPKLLEELDENEGTQLEGKLSLLSVERIAPELVQYRRFRSLDEQHLVSRLRKGSIPYSVQAYWIWYFLPIDSLISEAFLPELATIEEKDPLWFVYLMENEKLSDFYAGKTGKAFLPGKRHLLRAQLENPQTFMLALWKLIEIGGIDQKLVQDTARFLTQ